MDFSRPYGAYSSFSERLRLVKPIAMASRGTTPIPQTRSSASRGSTPGPSRVNTANSSRNPVEEPLSNIFPHAQPASPPELPVSGPSRVNTANSSRNTVEEPLPNTSQHAQPASPPELPKSADNSNSTDIPDSQSPSGSSDPPPPVDSRPPTAAGLTASETLFANALKDVVTEMRTIGKNIISVVERQTPTPSPSPARHKVKPHGEFKPQSPRKPRTAARGEMMVCCYLYY